jgi:hypothetical protein
MSLRRNRRTILVALASAVFGLAILACGGGDTGDVNEGGNTAPAEDKQDKPKVAAMGKDSVSLKEGLTISTSAPAPFSPSGAAAGTIPDGKHTKFNVTIVNGSQDIKDLALMTITVNSAAGTGSQIIDSEQNVTGSLGSLGKLAPGKTSTLAVAFSVPSNATSINVEIRPGFGDSALFEGTV